MTDQPADLITQYGAHAAIKQPGFEAALHASLRRQMFRPALAASEALALARSHAADITAFHGCLDAHL
jgi:hypothetical protein